LPVDAASVKLPYIGSVTLTNIGYWDGGAWHALGDGLGKSGDTVGALALTNGLIHAAGLFSKRAAFHREARFNASNSA